MAAQLDVEVERGVDDFGAAVEAVVLAAPVEHGIDAREERRGAVGPARQEVLARLAQHVELGIFDLEPGLDRIVVTEGEGPAQEDGIHVGLVAAQRGVEHVPVHVPVIADQPHPGLITQRHVEHAGQLGFLVFELIGSGDRTFKLVGRGAVDDADRPGDGILAEQGRLRPAQHFHPLHIDDRHADQLVAAVIEPIDEHCRRLLEALVVAGRDTADGDAVGDPGLGDAQVGNARGKLLEVGGALVRDGIAADRGNRDRHARQAFFALLGGHHDFIEATLVIRCGILCPECAGHRQCGTGQQFAGKLDHRVPPQVELLRALALAPCARG